jgi:EamA domain-containing membrane protein RarD
MKELRITMPELALIAGTRGALGAGAALLLGDKLGKEQRKAVGATLFIVGVVTTIPLLLMVFGKRRSACR